MNRFYLFSFLLHTTFFSTLGITTKFNLSSKPKVEIYKVKLAPLPQPKVLGKKIAKPESQLENESKKREEKSVPDKNKIDSKKRRGLPDGLPDIRPEIYTGSGRGFSYSYYLNILLNKISQNWNNPYKNIDIILKSVVYFEIDENGLISNIRIEKDSGDEIYNESTIRAIALTKKLPPLPQEFSDDYLKVHLEFLTAR
jgi:TonB family protein